jgi:uncharacterized protein YpiB (UPF0302 family)
MRGCIGYDCFGAGQHLGRNSILSKKNVFIEGIPGTGKSTLLNKLQKEIKDYQFYWEGDISPVELAWCSYMTKKEYNEVLIKWPDFSAEIQEFTKKEDNHIITAYSRIKTDQYELYGEMERFELYGGRRKFEEFHSIIMKRFKEFGEKGTVFECSFFQNIIEELMMFYLYDENQILEFYQQLIANIDMEAFLLIRLVTPDIEESLLQIIDERVDENNEKIWFQMVLEYYNQSPYGKKHPFNGVEDLIAHFTRRIRLEKSIMDQLFPNNYVELKSKQYDIRDIVKKING